MAKSAYKRIKQANEGVVKAISEIEEERAKLEWEKAVAGVDKAKEKHASDELKAQAKKAEFNAAKVAVENKPWAFCHF